MQSQFLPFIPLEDIQSFNSGNAHRAWRSFGCVYIPELMLHRFLLWAPNARSVSLVGDFNSWDEKALPMEKVDGGFWLCFVSGLEEGGEYMYAVHGADDVLRLKADPFAAYCSIEGKMASRVWSGGDYKWSDMAYAKNRARQSIKDSPMSVYEVHAGSWKRFRPDRALYCQLGDALAKYCTEPAA